VITTTERTADGAEVTQTTKARDAAQLKREFPEAYALYARHIAGARAAGGLGELGLEPLERLRAQLHENAEIDGALRDARRMLDEQRPMIEAQQRMAREQLQAARRQLDEQMRRLHEDQDQRRGPQE
jgi:ribosomal protein S21